MKFFMISLVLFFGLNIFAQSKHPRVAELEDLYKKQAMDYLESRFPGLPFAVIISVDPLRRNTSFNQPGEELPFYALEEEEIKDEWDNPKSTLYLLSTRVKKVQVTLHVPQNINDDELAEIQTTLNEVLRLVPARDEIKVMKREWDMFPNIKDYAIFGSIAMAVFLLGLLIILRSSVGKMTKSMSQMQSSLSKAASGGAGGGMSSSAGPMPVKAAAPNKGGAGKGDVKFNDPIKTREVIGKRVEDLLEKDDFLRLDNIIMMDELAEEDPHALGALLVNFPVEVQKQIFAVTTGTNWMEAFVYPGELDSRCLHLIEELCRVKPTDFVREWEQLLIQVWRLGTKRGQFLKGLKLEVAMTILNAMPKFIAVPTARSAFPGNWAAVIDPNFKGKTLYKERCIELYEEALKIKPLNDFDELNAYKQSKELLHYLKEASVNEEREVYEALPDSAALKIIRPPFYILFQQNEEFLQKFVSEVSIDDWAFALFNVPRDERRKIETHFEEKEKFLFLEKMRFLDKNKPDPEVIGEGREGVALKLELALLTAETEIDLADENNNENTPEAEDETQVA